MESNTRAVEYECVAIGEVQAGWSVGQPAFDMCDIGLEAGGSQRRSFR